MILQFKQIRIFEGRDLGIKKPGSQLGNVGQIPSILLGSLSCQTNRGLIITIARYIPVRAVGWLDQHISLEIAKP